MGDFERSLVKRPLFSQAGLNNLYTVEPTGSSVYLSAQVCAKGICWYNYITYFFVLIVSNKKEGLAIPLQIAEVGVSSPIEDELANLKGDLKELIGKAPEISKFSEYVGLAEKTAKLDEKTKELITLGIAIAVRCEPCILWHMDAVIKAGADEGDILEAIKVAVAMGGGPSLMYGIKAYDIMKELLKK